MGEAHYRDFEGSENEPVPRHDPVLFLPFLQIAAGKQRQILHHLQLGDVVRVTVGDKHRHEILRLHVHLCQCLGEVAFSASAVNQEPGTA